MQKKLHELSLEQYILHLEGMLIRQRVGDRCKHCKRINYGSQMTLADDEGGDLVCDTCKDAWDAKEVK